MEKITICTPYRLGEGGERNFDHADQLKAN